MITYEDEFIKNEIYIALISEICINTEFVNTLVNYNKSDMLTKTLVLLSVDWDKNGLLYTKHLHTFNNFISCS